MIREDKILIRLYYEEWKDTHVSVAHVEECVPQNVDRLHTGGGASRQTYTKRPWHNYGLGEKKGTQQASGPVGTGASGREPSVAVGSSANNGR